MDIYSIIPSLRSSVVAFSKMSVTKLNIEYGYARIIKTQNLRVGQVHICG